ncbi:hypothetical protein [Nonomuraea sp. NPDC049480]|uniref:hypothetical protein n=1 Tax=Nonomuraea sp. NPDC049480 TaxID=3364353 RepID=UPI0037B5A500
MIVLLVRDDLSAVAGDLVAATRQQLRRAHPRRRIVHPSAGAFLGSFFIVMTEKADVQTLLPNGKMNGWMKPSTALLTPSDRG